MYKKILLAYDGSAAGQKALLDSREITQLENASLHLLAVMPFDLVAVGPEAAYYDPDKQRAEEQKFLTTLHSGIDGLKVLGVEATGELAHGDPVDEIVKCAEKMQADLIVVGHKHRDSWVERWWRGSISKVLIELSPCSVLVVITK